MQARGEASYQGHHHAGGSKDKDECIIAAGKPLWRAPLRRLRRMRTLGMTPQGQLLLVLPKVR